MSDLEDINKTLERIQATLYDISKACEKIGNKTNPLRLTETMACSMCLKRITDDEESYYGAFKHFCKDCWTRAHRESLV